MMNAKFGLIAIPMIFMMMFVPTGAQACMGGEPGHTWFDGTLNATAHNYTARSFVVGQSAHNVHIRYHENTKVYVLTDAAMTNFSSGRPCAMVFDSNSSRIYNYFDLTPGKYWIVLDNKEESGNVSQQISVERYAVKAEGCVEYNPFLYPTTPGPSSSMVAVAMIGAAFIALVIKKRQN